ncbi:protein GUCD1-like isoform X2 [Patiria miniata]|uniref:Guanylyl cyclase n=1 Tax=Patiria miniata TaxID=46514 RepID=A0A914BHK7_PATMI|nr:protein GUCD1-like isoform X2 [Patiria miniata]
MGDKADVPQDGICLKIQHIHQGEDWDCGLACAKMILRFLHPEFEDGPASFDDICERLGFGESIWTVDLAHLMVQYNVKHQLYTITLGVDPTYQEVAFYNEAIKTEFTTEQERVNDLFASAASKGIQVEKRSVTNAEIVSHVSGHNPAIVLVDNTILQCERCKPSQKHGEGCADCFSFCDTGRGGGYVGHFIVLCGLDLTKNHFLYRNPGILEELCCCSFTNLDEARRSHGTDEDILFIYR